jgi:hypothetical protein
MYLPHTLSRTSPLRFYLQASRGGYPDLTGLPVRMCISSGSDTKLRLRFVGG